MNTIIDFLSSMSNWAIILLLLVGLGKVYSIFKNELKEKIEFMQKADVSTKKGLACALAQSACNEGMSLFSAFVMLLNYQRYGKMRGMCEIVEWSIRDESMHVEGVSKLFRTYCNEHSRIVDDTFKKEIYERYN